MSIIQYNNVSIILMTIILMCERNILMQWLSLLLICIMCNININNNVYY